MSGFTRTACPVSRSEFIEHATPLAVTIGGVANNITLDPKEFSTGSLGYTATNIKVTLTINGVKVLFQVGFNLTAVGSKELPA